MQWRADRDRRPGGRPAARRRPRGRRRTPAPHRRVRRPLRAPAIDRGRRHRPGDALELLDAPVSTPTDSDPDAAVHRLDKRRYCQRCQFFSTPPAVECTYEGAEIRSLEDLDRFVVSNCPVVAGEEPLQASSRTEDGASDPQRRKP
ncbi:hypothetical protein ACFQH6_07245 [Halobacteriaceae archaeon GCM10025711]